MRDYIVVQGIRICKNYENFVPETFGRLTTIGPRFLLRVNKSGRRSVKRLAFHVCRCECGEYVLARVVHLKKGHTASCGCRQRYSAAQVNRKHGMAGCPEYCSWAAMIQRCTNTNNSTYSDYGGRGIMVCDRWLDPENGFANFLADMGLRPSPEHSIDRIDVNGNYCPENCRWATRIEQQRNQRSNCRLEHNGVIMCVTEWAESLKMTPSTLYSRLRRGWSVEKAIATPVKNKVK